MAITMQGSWTLRFKSKAAAWAQRFVVSGAATGNGVFAGTAGTAVFVTGTQWSVKLQHQAPGDLWRDSAQRIGTPGVAGGLLSFDIRSDDGGNGNGGDADYDDLVITASMPASGSDYVVHGRVRSYQGLCLFNPCRPDFVVIDPPFHLPTLCERYPLLCEVLTQLYPERIRGPRLPLPDPAPDALRDLTPLVIPTGLPQRATGMVFRSAFTTAPPSTQPPTQQPVLTHLAASGKAQSQASLDAIEAQAVAALKTTTRQVAFDAAPVRAGAGRLNAAQLQGIAAIRDAALHLRCSVAPAPGLLLRFQEYDRTASERAGAPYTGSGARQDLGLAVTDEQGNYLFRFSPTLTDLAEETADVAAGEALATQLRPDVIVQVLGTGLTMSWESAPYYNITNLQRIDLCVPRERVHPSQGCGGDRVIQRVGDILMLHSALDAPGHVNTLDAEGRITCRNANAPQVDCAGWRGALRLYGCFASDAALRYAVYFKRPEALRWQAVNQAHALNYVPDLIAGGKTVGPFLRQVVPGVPLVGGPALGSAVDVPTYDNHDRDLNWIENDLKLILDSSLYRPWDEPGPVQWRIEAYDAAGQLVAGSVDQFTLYIHNRTAIAGRPGNGSKGDIAGIRMGTTELGDCGLFELTHPAAPLTVRHRAVDPEGFLHSWSLAVTRGNNVPVATFVAGGVTPKAYTAAVLPATPCDFTGSRDEPTADLDDYVATTLQPGGSGAAVTSWLPPGHGFCAFAFTLRAHDRVTDGRSAYPQVVFWQDLIGLSLPG
jgi:hypothetical protein